MRCPIHLGMHSTDGEHKRSDWRPLAYQNKVQREKRTIMAGISKEAQAFLRSETGSRLPCGSL